MNPHSVESESKSAEPAIAPTATVPTSTLLAYGSLAFPLAAAFIALQVIVPTFYAQTTGLSLTAIGGILLVARLFDMITDPLVGYWSDQNQNRFGRRKVFVVVAAPLIGVSVWFLFNPPATAATAYLLWWTIAIYVAGTLAIVPASAWAAELSPDYNQRSRVTGYRVAFGLSGTLIALVVSAIFAGDNSAELAPTLTAITWLVLLTLLISTAWAAFVVPDKSQTKLPTNSLASAWTLIKTPNPFRQLLVSFLLNAVGNAIPGTLFLLYVTHVLGVADLVGVFLFVYFVTAAAAVPVWVALSKRFGKHQTWSVAMIMACASFVWVPFLGPDTAMLFYVIVIATGFAMGADLVLPSAINADVIEWDALNSGYNRPGLFFALWGTAAKLSYALAVGIAFPLLDLVGFSATEPNSDSSLMWLSVLYGAPCIAFKLAAVWSMRNYPITEKVHADIRQQLARRDEAENRQQG